MFDSSIQRLIDCTFKEIIKVLCRVLINLPRDKPPPDRAACQVIGLLHAVGLALRSFLTKPLNLGYVGCAKSPSKILERTVRGARQSGTLRPCLSLLIRFRGQNRRGINKLTTLALAVETTPQRVDDIGLSGPPPDLRG